jgi:hypothetical protein
MGMIVLWLWIWAEDVLGVVRRMLLPMEDA